MNWLIYKIILFLFIYIKSILFNKNQYSKRYNGKEYFEQ